MLSNRENIYAAVFVIFSAAASFKTTGRRVVTWADVDKERQPALFMAQAGESALRVKGFPAKWTISVKLYLYCHAENDHAPVGPVMNPLLDAIAALVQTKANPDGSRRPLLPGETNDLGIAGVSHCWIEGNIETDEGALGSQGVAIIPVSILVA
jgi:hypothetical protein